MQTIDKHDIIKEFIIFKKNIRCYFLQSNNIFHWFWINPGFIFYINFVVISSISNANFKVVC